MKIVSPFLLSLITLTACSDKSLLWEVSGNGLEKPSYLYGTMHTSDERVFDFTSNTTKAFASSEILALELNMDSINMGGLLTAMVMDSITLDDLLTPDEYKDVSTYFKDSLQMPITLFNKIYPMFTSTIVSSKGLGSEKEDALDIYFFKEAKKTDKLVVGLEKAEEQIATFKAIPLSDQAAGLVSAVKEAYANNNSASSEMDQLIEYYVSGDVNKMAEYAVQSDAATASSDSLFESIFITNRNKVMVTRCIPLIHEKPTFIAVGAAHLGGKNGLIELLRAEGYTVKPK